jgi:hypothetical protein
LTTLAATQGGNTASTGTSGQTSNLAAVTYGAPTAAGSGGVNWGSIQAIGIFDAVTGGNMLWWAPLASAKTVNAGDAAPSFAIGALTLQIDD